MVSDISIEGQVLFLILLIALLFSLVIVNNKRNKKKQYERESRNFRKNFYSKRKNKTRKS